MVIAAVWALVQFIVSVGIGLYTWHSGQRRAERGDLVAIEDKASKGDAVIATKVQTLELDLERVKAQLPHVPHRSEFATLSASVESMREESARVQRTLDRIEAYLQEATWAAPRRGNGG